MSIISVIVKGKTRILAGSIILAVALATVVGWMHIEKAAHPNTAITSIPASVTMPPKTIVPARVILADVNQNMQAALAARQQKLAQWAKGK